MRLNPLIATLATLVLCCALFARPALAQAEPAIESPVSRDLLQSRLQEAEASIDPAEDSQQPLLDLYRRALSQIDQRKNFEAQAAEFIAAREAAPAQASVLRKSLESLSGQPPAGVSDRDAELALTELDQRLLAEKSELAMLDSRLTELEAALERRSQRNAQIRNRIDAATRRRAEIAETLKQPVADARPDRLVEARRWALQLESLALGAELDMLNQELVGLPTRLELLTLQRDEAGARLSRKRQIIEQFETLVAERRQAEAASVIEQAEESEREAFGKHALLQEYAQENRRLGEQLERLAAELTDLSTEKSHATAEANRVTENFRLARLKLDIGGLDEALGQVLLEQRSGLPDAADFKAAEERGRRLVVESSLRLIRNQQERAQLRDAERYADEKLAHLPQTWQSLLREDLMLLIEMRRGLIDKAIAADDRNLQALGELDVARRQLSQAVIEYDRFLDEHLLWVRTAEPPSAATLASARQELAIFITASNWIELGRALVWPGSPPWLVLLGFMLFGLLSWGTPGLRRLLAHSAVRVGRIRHDRYTVTLRALMLTLLLALRWPLLIAMASLHLAGTQAIGGLGELGMVIGESVSSREFASAIGTAGIEIATYLFYFLAFRVLCRDDGLAVNHFGWNSGLTAGLRDATLRLTLVLLPAVFLMNVAFAYDSAALGSGLSRLFFIILLLSVAWYFYRLLAPADGVLYAGDPAAADPPLSWQRYLWLLLALALPLSLAVLATIGYVYTAVEFGSRVFDTLWLIVATILTHQLMVRWIVLAGRRLKFRDRLERRRALLAAREANPDAEAADAGLTVEEPEVDVNALSEETGKLVNSMLALMVALGMWLIWADVLPAFGILDEISLWSYSTTIGGAEEVVPVSLGDVILGGLIAIFGLIAARRIPALLEISLLTRLNITAGSRYAISRLTQYSIVAIGILMVFNLLGGRWGDVQWLVAALGVGIGFGLQEIVANFICGLILLFERPIRIGDVVTVGDTTGVVTRIRIRSTTIRNWDQQELIVPNKEFITGRLLNWTLTDPVTRIVVTVGIAYGSDVGLALKLISEAATEHERVLTEPAPLVTFEKFGDSSLEITLRCYIGSMEFRLQTMTEVNLEINRKLNEAGIEISFPQRDVHLDAGAPLDVRILPANAES